MPRKPAKTPGIDQLPSGKYRARYTDPTGKRRTKTFHTHGEAAGWKQEQERLMALNAWMPPEQASAVAKLNSTTVKDVFESMMAARRYAQGTRQQYGSLFAQRIEPLFGQRPVVSITRQEVSAWHLSMRENYNTEKRTRDAYALLHNIFAHAVDEEFIASNPAQVKNAMRKPQRKKEFVILTAEQVGEVIDAIPERYKAVVLIAGACSLRIGEWSELRRRDIVEGRDNKGNPVWKFHVQRTAPDNGRTIEVQNHTKDGKSRYITIPDSAYAFLQEHMKKYTAPGGDALLFTNSKGNRIRRNRFNDMLKSAPHGLSDHGITISSHAFRHYGATAFQRAGGTLAETQARLGHATAEAAMMYQHATESRDIDVANQIQLPHIASVTDINDFKHKKEGA